jgi:hypothetical protein
MLQRRHLRSVLALLLACSGMHVSSAREYYENAEECFDWARTAKTERERLIFLQMAETWLDVARRREANEARAEPASGWAK